MALLSIFIVLSRATDVRHHCKRNALLIAIAATGTHAPQCYVYIGFFYLSPPGNTIWTTKCLILGSNTIKKMLL